MHLQLGGDAYVRMNISYITYIMHYFLNSVVKNLCSHASSLLRPLSDPMIPMYFSQVGPAIGVHFLQAFWSEENPPVEPPATYTPSLGWCEPLNPSASFASPPTQELDVLLQPLYCGAVLSSELFVFQHLPAEVYFPQGSAIAI